MDCLFFFEKTIQIICSHLQSPRAQQINVPSFFISLTRNNQNSVHTYLLFLQYTSIHPRCSLGNFFSTMKSNCLHFSSSLRKKSSTAANFTLARVSTFFFFPVDDSARCHSIPISSPHPFLFIFYYYFFWPHSSQTWKGCEPNIIPYYENSSL